MIQNKKIKLVVFIIINLLVAFTLTYIIIEFSPTRYSKLLTFKESSNNKYEDLIREKGIFTTFYKPVTFVSKLDIGLREKKILQDQTNRCHEIKNIRGILPISFTMDSGMHNIEITSTGKSEVDICAQFIVSQVNLYNQSVRDRFKENYTFFSDFDERNSVVDQKELDERIKKYTLFLDKVLLKQEQEKEKINQSNLNIALLNTYLNLNNYSITSKMRNSKNYKDIEKVKFFKVVDQIEKLQFIEEQNYITPKPPANRIFLAIFSILTFVYLFFIFFKDSGFKRKFLEFFK